MCFLQARVVFIFLTEITFCRPHSAVENVKKNRNTQEKVEPGVKADIQDKQSSKKKNKKKKGKKGKGRGKKSSREASEEDKAALKKLLDSLRGSRRLMVSVSVPFASI